jgi:hypothetical protein
MTCREAIAEAFRGKPRTMTTAEVVARVEAAHPERPWKRSTIGTLLIALSANHTSAHHYPSFRRHAFLFSLGDGRYRPWDETQDGPRPGRGHVPARQRSRPAKVAPAAMAERRASAAEALLTTDRSPLVRNLVDEIHDEPFQPRHRRQRHGSLVTGWPDRLRTYFWPHPGMGLRETERAMAPWFESAGVLARRLLEQGGWSGEERQRATGLAAETLRWGRVPQRDGFDEATVEAVFRRALGLPGGETAPMNSGWTKVAAMATAFLEGERDRAPHVIWDSRVSTSIVWRLDRMLAKTPGSDPKGPFTGLGVVGGRGGTRPRSLELHWAHPYGRWWGQEAGSAMVREIRDVLNQGGHGWMPLSDGGEGRWTIRGVESVLFMDGY